MAPVYGSDSTYLSRKERDYYLWWLALLLVPIAAVAIVARLGSPLALLGAAVAGLGFVFFICEPAVKWMRRKTGQVYTGRWGEISIKEVLKELPSDYAVYEGVVTEADKGDIDYVVVGPTGVFTVEVKAHKGEVAYNGFGITLDGRPFPDKNVLRQMHGETHGLKIFLQERVHADFYVRPILVFANDRARVDIGSSPVQNVNVVHKDGLIQLILSFPYCRFPVPQPVVEKALRRTVK